MRTDDVEGAGELEALGLLHLIASGVIRLWDLHQEGRAARVPYPLELQRALDKLTVVSLRRGAPPPIGVPALLEWCRRRPIREWIRTLPEGVAGEDDRLLEGAFPTDFCREWALVSPNVESEVLERQFFADALSICKATQNQAAYVAFRSLLIERPVLTSLELLQHSARPELSSLAEPIRRAYAPAPLELMGKDRQFICCVACANLMRPGRDDIWRCGDERCARQGRGSRGRELPAKDEPLWLRAPLRTFISAPGRSELRMKDRLEQMGLVVELWPSFDAYDLRIVFTDGQVWAVDVKDWASPVALARRLKAGPPFPGEPSWAHAFYVFPEERLRERRDYVRAFEQYRGASRVEALGEERFMADVRARVARDGGSPQGVA